MKKARASQWMQGAHVVAALQRAGMLRLLDCPVKALCLHRKGAKMAQDCANPP